jgi:hypothetical protein
MDCRFGALIMYQQLPDQFGQPAQCIKRLADNAFIPFAVDNTDYQQFKQDLSEGAELLDADGNTMSAEQVAEFLQTLP